MSPCSQQGHPSQAPPSWPDTIMGMEGNRSVQRPLAVRVHAATRRREFKA